MAVRIGDIAKKAGVAKTTVSLVLNGKSSPVRISKNTERRILEAAKELNYSPSFSARALAKGKTNTIGILVGSINNNFYAEFFKYLNDACPQSGYSVFITSSEFDFDRERRILESFLNRCVDAVIINRTANMHDDLIQQLVSRGIHVVIEGEMGPIPFPLVSIDEFRVADLTAEHLWSLGHRNILYFSAEKVKDQSRIIHYHRRMNFLKSWNRLSASTPIQEFSTADPTHGGSELAEWLAMAPKSHRPTAIACATDRLALSLMSSLRMYPIRVPEDLSIIGCDDISAAAEAVIPLTTVRLPVEKVAQVIWGLLSDKLGISPAINAGGPVPQILVEPELMVRESTERRGANRQ